MRAIGAVNLHVVGVWWDDARWRVVYRVADSLWHRVLWRVASKTKNPGLLLPQGGSDEQ